MPRKDEAVTNRLVVGTVALTFAACGLAHISDGIPNPPGGAEPMRAAGGIIGFLASSPLASAVSRPGAVVLLVLLALFGALVVTGTPVRQIPQRVRDLRDRVIHGADDDERAGGDRGRPDASGPAGARSTCSRSADGDEAFEQAAVVVPGRAAGCGRGRSARTRPRRPPAPPARRRPRPPSRGWAPRRPWSRRPRRASPRGSSSCR